MGSCCILRASHRHILLRSTKPSLGAPQLTRHLYTKLRNNINDTSACILSRRVSPVRCTNFTTSTQQFQDPKVPADKQPTKQSNPQQLHTPIKTTAALRQKLTAATSHENIYNIPNFLTFSRLLAAPAIGYLILTAHPTAATLLLLYAGLTDLVDGYLARRYNLQSVVGSIIDPLADKSLMTILTVCLAATGALPMSLATLILGRDVSLAVAATYYRWASLPPPKTAARYWDFSLPSAEVHPTGVSKVNTALQLVLIGAATAGPVAGPTVETALTSLGLGVGAGDVMWAAQWLVAGTTAWSGMSYLWTRGAVKILTGNSERERRKILSRGRIVLGSCFALCAGVALVLES